MSKSCGETPPPVRPTLDPEKANPQLEAYDKQLAALHAKMLEKRVALPELKDFLKFLNTDLLGKLRKNVALLRSKNTSENDLHLQLLNTHLKLYQGYHDELSKCQAEGLKKRHEVTNELPENVKKAMRSLTYKNIGTLKEDDIAAQLKPLHDAVEAEQVSIDDVRAAIFPPNDYAYAMYMSTRFVSDTAVARLAKLASRQDPSAIKVRKILQHCVNDKKYQSKHQDVFKKFAEVFGGDVDWSKRAYVFEDPALGEIPEELEENHVDALDVFYKGLASHDGPVETGPALTAYAPGIVVAASEDWKGENTEESYAGGGLSPISGNGVIIFNPYINSYFAYYHLQEVKVKTGDFVKAGDVLGHGGNSGVRARQAGHGEHLHFEIHKFDIKTGTVSVLYWDLIAKLLKEARETQIATR